MQPIEAFVVGLMIIVGALITFCVLGLAAGVIEHFIGDDDD